MDNKKIKAVVEMIVPQNVISMVETKLKKLPKVIKGLKISAMKKIKGIKANKMTKSNDMKMDM